MDVVQGSRSLPIPGESSVTIGFYDGVMFGISRRSADARLAHIECVAVETLRLIYQREVDRTLGSLVVPGSMN